MIDAMARARTAGVIPVCDDSCKYRKSALSHAYNINNNDPKTEKPAELYIDEIPGNKSVQPKIKSNTKIAKLINNAI